MMQNQSNSFFSSLKYAIAGLTRLVGERNIRIHLAAAVSVALTGFIVRLSSAEWLAVILASGAVMSAEAFNTAIEILCDRVCPGFDPQIKLVKDVAAAAVLILALTAVIVGCIIFLPKIITLL